MQNKNSIITDPPWLKYSLIGLALCLVVLFLVLPLLAIFTEALRQGFEVYFDSLTSDDTWSAIRLTLITAAWSVPLNTIFGVAVAWVVTKFEFRGKTLLVTFVDLPFSISPVVVGLMFVLVFGVNGWFGSWFEAHGFKIIFSLPGIILVTVFITFPFIARELIPLMEAQQKDEELAAVMLGARGWQIFWRITVPNIKWALLYGMILANARAMGEFGAVAVVSGHIRGETVTLPLHVEILYNEYQASAAFASASLLTLLALFSLILKSIVEWRSEKKMNRTA